MSNVNDPIPLAEATETIADALQAWGNHTAPHLVKSATVTSTNTVTLRICREIAFHETGRAHTFRITIEAIQE